MHRRACLERASWLALSILGLSGCGDLEHRPLAKDFAASAGYALGQLVHPVAGAEHEVDAPTFGPRDTYAVDLSLAFDGVHYLVVWGTSVSLEAALVTADARVGDRIDLSATTSEPVVAFDGTTFIVAWTESPGIRFARVGRDGAMLDVGGIPAGTGRSIALGNIAVDSAGTSLLTWFADGVIYAERIAQGRVLDQTPLIITTNANGNVSGKWIEGASDGNQFLVAWIDTGRQQLDIDTRMIQADGTLGTPTPLTFGSWPEESEDVRVAFGGGHYLVTWLSASAGNPEFGSTILGSRLDSSGAILDANPLGIDTSTISLKSAPAVTWTGAEFLVSFRQPPCCGSDTDDVRGRRVSSAGVVSSPSFIIAPGWPDSWPAGAQGLSSNGVDQAFAVWFTSTGPGYIFGSRIQGERILDAPGVAIAKGGNGQTRPVVAFSGGGYLAVWADQPDPSRPPNPSTIRAVRVALDGTIIAPSFTIGAGVLPKVTYEGGAYLVTSYCGQSTFCSARVAIDGTLVQPYTPCTSFACTTRRGLVAHDPILDRWLVAYSTRPGLTSTAPLSLNVDLRRSDGTLIPGTRKVLTSTRASAAARDVVFDGQRYIVTWDDVDPYLGTGGTQVRASHVGSDGAMLDRVDGFSLTTTAAAGGRQGPKLISFAGRVLAAWEDTRSGASQVYATFVDGAGPVDPVGFAMSSTLTGPLALSLATAPDDHTAMAVYSGPRLMSSWVKDDGTVFSPSFVIAPEPAPGGFSIATSSAGESLIVYSRYVGTTTAADRVMVRLVSFAPGSPDAGALDALPAPDAAAPDASSPDASSPDASVDASTPDASTPDASAPDASAADSGAIEAGSAPMDAGPAPHAAKSGGCGCSAERTSTEHMPIALAWLFFAGAVARRRRAT
jgi:MYXO-CTERM domain-containing protein